MRTVESFSEPRSSLACPRTPGTRLGPVTLPLVEAALWRLLARLGCRPLPAELAAFLLLVTAYGDARETAGEARSATVTASSVVSTVSPVAAASEGLSGLSAVDRLLDAEAVTWAHVLEVGEKRCRRCGAWAPLGGFYVDSHSRDGRRATCKACDVVTKARQRALARARRVARARGQAS